MGDRDRSPIPKRRRSRSPETREYRHDGGGRSSSRNRSPGYRASTSRRDDRGGARGSGSGSGKGNGSGRRDSGYGDRRPGKGEYSEKDREKERGEDRKRYDAAVKKEAGVEVRLSQSLWRCATYLRPSVLTVQEDGEEPAPDLAKPNFGSSGLLARETNMVKGVQIKYNEPPEARKPLKNWRLYVFKGKEQVGKCHTNSRRDTDEC